MRDMQHRGKSDMKLNQREDGADRSKLKGTNIKKTRPEICYQETLLNMAMVIFSL